MSNKYGWIILGFAAFGTLALLSVSAANQTTAVLATYKPATTSIPMVRQ